MKWEFEYNGLRSTKTLEDVFVKYMTRIRHNYVMKFLDINYWNIDFVLFYLCGPTHRKLIMIMVYWFWWLIIFRWIKILTILNKKIVTVNFDPWWRHESFTNYWPSVRETTDQRSEFTSKTTNNAFFIVSGGSSRTIGRVVADLRRHELCDATAMFFVELNSTIWRVI